MTKTPGKIEILLGDITQTAADAIVNAAKSSLMGGGGVDGAIHQAGGPAILEACIQIVNQTGPCPAGEAVITTAGNLPAKYVIHTVGPVWSGGHKGEPEKLANCYCNALLLAAKNHCRTIAFPNISTGVYGYPKPEAAQIALATIKQTLPLVPDIEKVVMVCFDQENFELLKQLMTNKNQ
jgi:O-acetyl-ADP-ribose deacetylase (regulator of RNase III)